jgi:hypothetical protein
MKQDKAIFMSQAFQKSPFGGFRGTHFLIKITKYWFLFCRLKLHFINFPFLIDETVGIDLIFPTNTPLNFEVYFQYRPL